MVGRFDGAHMRDGDIPDRPVSECSWPLPALIAPQGAATDMPRTMAWQAAVIRHCPYAGPALQPAFRMIKW